MEISVCKKICNECAFNGSTKNTLYAEAFNIIDKGQIFPCHMYLKSKTGCEYLGTETLDEIKVCRGYVCFMKKYNPHISKINFIWKELFKDISNKELDSILTLEELKDNHIGLRDKIYLGN